MPTPTDLRIEDHPETKRYEAWRGDTLTAYVEYSVLATGLLIAHTEVLPAFEGQGIGGAIARYVLEDMRAKAQKIIPVCQFFVGYLRRHPEYLDVVNEDSRRAFKV